MISTTMPTASEVTNQPSAGWSEARAARDRRSREHECGDQVGPIGSVQRTEPLREEQQRGCRVPPAPLEIEPALCSDETLVAEVDSVAVVVYGWLGEERKSHIRGQARQRRQ